MLWLELAVLVLGGLFIAFPLRAQHRRRALGRASGLLVQILAMLAVMGLAVLAPVKFVDQPLEQPLSAPQMPLPSLLAELEAQGFAVAPTAARSTEVVTLSSKRPTYSELNRQLRQQAGLSLRIGHCGTSPTLLWGLHRLGRIEIIPAEEP